MKRIDIFVLVSRVVVFGLALTSFLVSHIPSRAFPGFIAFLSLKFVTFMLAFSWVPMMILFHVASLRQWFGWPADGHYWITQVVIEWVFTIATYGTGSSALFVAMFLSDVPLCVPHRSICRSREEISAILALVASCVSFAIALVQSWARAGLMARQHNI